MKKSLQLMKKISWWAKMHKSYARIIIVVSFIFLNALAFFTGYPFPGGCPHRTFRNHHSS